MLDTPEVFGPDPSFRHSKLREQIVEHAFVGDILRCLWTRGCYDAEVLRPAFDAHGYDIVIRLADVTRYIQLKTLTKGGRATHFAIHDLLSEKDCGCVIVITVERSTLAAGPYLWFGSDPGAKLSSLGAFANARSPRGNSLGVKPERRNHRKVPKSRFERLGTIDDVVHALFGDRIPRSPSAVILDHLPKQRILSAYGKAPGSELASKFMSPESSSALVANTFGIFLEQPGKLPRVPNTSVATWEVERVEIEECVPFPWYPKGRHPWLDVVVETATHFVGIESKRYEPFRGGKKVEFSDTYAEADWGPGMQRYDDVRKRLLDGTLSYDHLDASQLVKHAYGLSTQARKKGKRPILIYLYAEPQSWPDGEPIDHTARGTHAWEIKHFAREVSGADVLLQACSYAELLAAFRSSGDPELSAHAEAIVEAFAP